MKLLAEAGINLNTQDIDGWTPLHHAVANNQDEVVDLLLERGADKKITNKDGITAFMLGKKDNVKKPVQGRATMATFRSTVITCDTSSISFFEIGLPDHK